MSPIRADSAGNHAPKATTLSLSLGSVGIVYGDIGTSPLYALREGLHAATEGHVAQANEVIGIVSLLLWLLITIATCKYVVLILRADNNGEGGTLSLLALCRRALGGNRKFVLAAGIVGTALFFGDAMITPAISVLSAVEGVALVAPGFAVWVVPTTVGILLVLFWFQSSGTGGISRMFGPIMLVWFATIALLGLIHIFDAPQILWAFSPVPGISYLLTHGENAVPVLGSVFLAITGAEALYADMGHFGRKPIRLAWITIVLPALALSYLGQGALVLSDPSAAANPFFLLAPTWGLPLLVGLATLATIIASQAVITGAFSFAHQAAQLGLLPRFEVLHTSETQQGQIFLPRVNLILMVFVILLVVTFGSSAKLATAYGIAVTGEMLITTVLAVIVFRTVWHWSRSVVLAVFIPIGIMEVALLGANLTKFADGGYLPIAVAIILAITMWTWTTGTSVVQAKSRESLVSLDTLINSLKKSNRLAATPGTAVFLTAEPVAAPPALLHNLKHNGVLHARNLIVSVRTANRPHIDPEEMVQVEALDDRFTRVRMTFGYMDAPNVPKALRLAVKFDIMTTSFFLNRRSYRIGTKGELYRWQARLYASMSKMAVNATEFFKLPTNRVVELGQQINL